MISLRDILEIDYIPLYELLRDRSPEINISHQHCPSFEEHCRFWRSKPYPYAKAIVVDDNFAGYCYLTDRNEIGMFLKKEYQGQNIGSIVLKIIKEEFKGHQLFANIAPMNGASKRFFERHGFKFIQETYRFESC